MTDTQGGDQWSTPTWLFDYYNNTFNFDLDAAASVQNHKVPQFFSVEQNSLQQSWQGYQSVWCNPPYSDPSPWVNKAVAEVANAHNQTIVMLLPSDTSTRWFHEAYANAVSMVLFQGRIKFGGVKGSPRWGNVIFIFRSGKALYHQCKVYCQNLKDIQNAINEKRRENS